MIQIKKAVKYGSKLRMALYGPSGSGKTYTALTLASALAEGKRVLVIDTERGSASKYADLFDFDVIDLESFHPNSYIEAIRAVEQSGEYDVLVLDSISHEWEGPQGSLELAGRDFTNWAKVTPLHNSFVDAMLRADLHVIATMRAKEEYVMEKEEGKSKATVRKVGMEPIQRKGIQYEFDVAALLEIDNTMVIEKSRCSQLAGKTIMKPDARVADMLKAWLSGAPALPALPTKRELFERGTQKGMWEKPEVFYAAVSARLSAVVNQRSWDTLSRKQVLDVAQMIEDEPVQQSA